jgi:hypothetical protein
MVTPYVVTVKTFSYVIDAKLVFWVVVWFLAGRAYADFPVFDAFHDLFKVFHIVY